MQEQRGDLEAPLDLGRITEGQRKEGGKCISQFAKMPSSGPGGGEEEVE